MSSFIYVNVEKVRNLPTYPTNPSHCFNCTVSLHLSATNINILRKKQTQMELWTERIDYKESRLISASSVVSHIPVSATPTPQLGLLGQTPPPLVLWCSGLGWSCCVYHEDNHRGNRFAKLKPNPAVSLCDRRIHISTLLFA